MKRMIEGVDLGIFGIMTVVFVAITMVLGWYGYKNTHSNEEFLLGRNKAGPLIIALSYGTTFLSTSAVIGFGGQAAVHGLSLIWLCAMTLFVGLVIAFLVFGKRTRRLGRELGAATFADLLGKVYKSKGIRTFTAILILVMMPIYAAAVLKGGVNSLAVITGMTEYYNYILVALAIIVAVYVVYGGIIAVMYNDALQAGIMFGGMAIILVVTYATLGGITEANSALSGMWDRKMLETDLGTLPGFNGWTSVADFGSQEWMVVITTLLMGVGIGSLTQPQLTVRYMSAKDDRDLDKSLIVGSVFMFLILGTAFSAGALSNVYFAEQHGGLTAFEYVHGVLGLNTDFIVPQYILEVFHGFTFGDVFLSLFLLSLVCASVSTISALMHTIGSAGGYDLYSIYKIRKGHMKGDSQSVRVNRIFIVVILVLVVVYCYMMPKDIIAKATTVFMGLTSAALLPAYFHGLYSGKPSKKAAVVSIVTGVTVYMFLALFVNGGLSVFIPICDLITGQPVLFPDSVLSYTDPLAIALPASAIAMVVALVLIGKTDKEASA